MISNYSFKILDCYLPTLSKYEKNPRPLCLCKCWPGTSTRLPSPMQHTPQSSRGTKRDPPAWPCRWLKRASPTLFVESTVLVSRNIQSVASARRLPKSTAIGCANCVGVLWLCSSLMICSFSHHESFWILAPSQLLYWSEIWPASKIFCLFLGLFLLSGSRQGAQNGVETSQKWGHPLLW